MARKAKKYRLKPYPKSRLPKSYQSTIRRTHTLKKRIRDLKIPSVMLSDMPSAAIKKIERVLDTLEDLINVNIDWDMLDDHLKSDTARKVASDLQWTIKKLQDMSGEIRCLLEGGNAGDCGFLDDEDMNDGISISSLLHYMADNELEEFELSLPLVYAAYQDFVTKREYIADIGPFTIYLETGALLNIPESEVDSAVNYALDAIEHVYRKFKEIDIPDYAIEGPISLEVGLPPLAYGGVYIIDSNEIQVTLRSRAGLSLSANYRAEAKEASDVFGYSLHELFSSRSADVSRIPVFYTIAHELAHRIYYRGLRRGRKQLWDEIYEHFSMSEEEQTLISEYARVGEHVKEWQGKLSSYEADRWPETVIASTKRLLNGFKKSMRKFRDALSEELLYLAELHSRYGFHPPITTFSKMRWTTQYGRTNKEEAFAETFVTSVWPDLAAKVNRRVDELTDEEAQGLFDLMWYFITSVEPQKPR